MSEQSERPETVPGGTRVPVRMCALRCDHRYAGRRLRGAPGLRSRLHGVRVPGLRPALPARAGCPVAAARVPPRRWRAVSGGHTVTMPTLSHGPVHEACRQTHAGRAPARGGRFPADAALHAPCHTSGDER